jgi:elongation factor 1-beta
MSNLKEINGRLTSQPYVAGYVASKEDAALFEQMFGTHTAVAQWAARLATYYASERAEILSPKPAAAPKAAAAPAAAAAPKAAAPKAAAKDDEDSDIDLFGEETEEEKAALEAKKKADVDAAAAKKKAAPIAKSSILLDIKPWEDTQDLNELALKIKAVERDGLLWGAHKLVPVAYGVKKLQLLLVIEDDKVSSEDLEDIILGMEDDVQSMDVVAWNKI